MSAKYAANTAADTADTTARINAQFAAERAADAAAETAANDAAIAKQDAFEKAQQEQAEKNAAIQTALESAPSISLGTSTNNLPTGIDLSAPSAPDPFAGYSPSELAGTSALDSAYANTSPSELAGASMTASDPFAVPSAPVANEPARSTAKEWSQMTPAERGAYYAEHPIEGKIASGMQDAFGFTTLGMIPKTFAPDAWANSRLEKQGYDPESFAYGPPDPNFSSQGNAAAKQEGAIAAVNAANAAGAGLAASPMAKDPAQKAAEKQETDTERFNSFLDAVQNPTPLGEETKLAGPLTEAPAPEAPAPAPAPTANPFAAPTPEAEAPAPTANPFAAPTPEAEAPAPTANPFAAPTPEAQQQEAQQRQQEAQQREADARAQQEAQQRQQEAQQREADARAQQEAQQRQQQEAAARAQQEAQARQQQEADARAQQAEARAQQESAARAQAEAQARQQQEAEARQQQEAQQQQQQEADARAQSSENSNDGGDGGDGGGGGGDARGGYYHHGQFDQRMAQGGISGHLRPPLAFFQNGKYSFHPPQMYADGGVSDPYNLGSYSDGGRLLKGPGDGVSDSIPATIGHGQPARLADGEFVIPARIVSEIGNGSTDAGARKLYAMMDRIQSARGKTVGKGKVAKNTRADKYLPR
jgi:hypothetical protein